MKTRIFILMLEFNRGGGGAGGGVGGGGIP